jgi:hypothetical protein
MRSPTCQPPQNKRVQRVKAVSPHVFNYRHLNKKVLGSNSRTPTSRFFLASVVLLLQSPNSAARFWTDHVSVRSTPMHLQPKGKKHVWLQVLTVVTIKMAVFWVVASCRMVWVYQRSRGVCCLHHQCDRLTSGTLINSYQSTWRYNPEDSHPKKHTAKTHQRTGTQILSW